MGKLFDFNNPVMVFLARILDLLFLNLLWLICCIPIVTIVPATTAMYYVTFKMVHNEDSGIARQFFHSFWENMRQGVLLTILFLAGAVVLYLDYFFCKHVPGVVGNILQFAFAIVGFVYLMVVCYTTPLLSRFENTVKQTIKNAFFLSLRHVKTTLIILLMHVGPVLVFAFLPELSNKIMPLWIFLFPAVIAFLSTICLRKVFDGLIKASQDDSADSSEEQK